MTPANLFILFHSFLQLTTLVRRLVKPPPFLYHFAGILGSITYEICDFGKVISAPAISVFSFITKARVAETLNLNNSFLFNNVKI